MAGRRRGGATAPGANADRQGGTGPLSKVKDAAPAGGDQGGVVEADELHVTAKCQAGNVRSRIVLWEACRRVGAVTFI